MAEAAESSCKESPEEREDSNDQLPEYDDEECLDSRVKGELEALNNASESINKLENEVQKARAKFRLLKAESSQQLGALYKKIGRKFISKARPYYDLVGQSYKAQIEAQRAAVKFQRANGIYKAAKETVTLAEQQLVTENGSKLAFDSAWQEMLNHATFKFMESEKEKRVCEMEHQQKSNAYAALQQKLAYLSKDMPRAISKSKQFYDLKERLHSRLQAERQNAEDLHLALICSKQKYRMALNSLENISEQVHSNRQLRFDLPMRTPGVGAEADTCSELSEMPSMNFDFMSEAGSQASYDDFSDDGGWSPQLDADLNLDDEWSECDGTQAEKKTSDGQNALDQLWSRFGNKFSRMVQDSAKEEKTADGLKERQLSREDNLRDNTVEGAEDDNGSEQLTTPCCEQKSFVGDDSEPVHPVSGHTPPVVTPVAAPLNIPQKLRRNSNSSPQLVLSKPPLPRTMAVSALKSGVYVTCTPPLPPQQRQMERSAAVQQKRFPLLQELAPSHRTSSSSNLRADSSQLHTTQSQQPQKVVHAANTLSASMKECSLENSKDQVAQCKSQIQPPSADALEKDLPATSNHKRGPKGEEIFV